MTQELHVFKVDWKIILTKPVGTKAETAIGEETVRKDSARFSPDVQEANDW